MQEMKVGDTAAANATGATTGSKSTSAIDIISVSSATLASHGGRQPSTGGGR
jgi:hypothetical protein